MPTLPDGELDLIGQALDEETERRMHHVEFKLDYLLSCAHAARAMVKTAEELLNRWFEILDHNLASRVNIQLGAPPTSSSSSSATSSAGSALASSNLSDPSSLGGFLAKYVSRRLPPAGFVISGYEEVDDMPSSSSTSRILPPPPALISGMDPRDLLRTLSLVDRAGREVPWAGETGMDSRDLVDQIKAAREVARTWKTGMDPRDLLRAFSLIDRLSRGNWNRNQATSRSDQNTSTSTASVTRTAPAETTVMMPTQRAVIPMQHTSDSDQDSTSIESDGGDGYDADAEDNGTNAAHFSDQYSASVLQHDADYDADAEDNIDGL
ncbi:hypothetical protein F5887DRAFT_1074613 [Amanita rubescens]|nr:hypothetical protein F5887DRAFT_1074613 [Amanita rubescens]